MWREVRVQLDSLSSCAGGRDSVAPLYEWHPHFRSWVLARKGQQSQISWFASPEAIVAPVFSGVLYPWYSLHPTSWDWAKEWSPHLAAAFDGTLLSVTGTWGQDDRCCCPVPPRKITLLPGAEGRGSSVFHTAPLLHTLHLCGVEFPSCWADSGSKE